MNKERRTGGQNEGEGSEVRNHSSDQVSLKHWCVLEYKVLSLEWLPLQFPKGGTKHG